MSGLDLRALRLLRAVAPGPLRPRIETLISRHRLLGHSRLRDVRPTTVEGWEEYAKVHLAFGSGHLGDEWNDAAEIGIDCADGEIVGFLDDTLFGPFLGTVDVLLEIGPGGGRFTEVLLRRCRRLIALDTSPTMLELLRRRFRGTHLEPLRFDGRRIDLPDGSVDAAFSYDVLVHLNHWEIFNLLRELRRVGRPGARLVLHHANTFSELGWRRFLTDLPGQLGRHPYWGTLTLMTPEVMAALAQRAGLALERCVTDVVRRDAISLLSVPDGD